MIRLFIKSCNENNSNVISFQTKKKNILSRRTFVMFLVLVVNIFSGAWIHGQSQLYYSGQEYSGTFLLLSQDKVAGVEVQTAFIYRSTRPIYLSQSSNIDIFYNVDSIQVQNILNTSPVSEADRLTYLIIQNHMTYGRLFSLVVARSAEEVVTVMSRPRTNSAVELMILMPDGSIWFRNEIFIPQE